MIQMAAPRGLPISRADMARGHGLSSSGALGAPQNRAINRGGTGSARSGHVAGIGMARPAGAAQNVASNGGPLRGVAMSANSRGACTRPHSSGLAGSVRGAGRPLLGSVSSPNTPAASNRRLSPSQKAAAASSQQAAAVSPNSSAPSRQNISSSAVASTASGYPASSAAPRLSAACAQPQTVNGHRRVGTPLTTMSSSARNQAGRRGPASPLQSSTSSNRPRAGNTSVVEDRRNVGGASADAQTAAMGSATSIRTHEDRGGPLLDESNVLLQAGHLEALPGLKARVAEAPTNAVADFFQKALSGDQASLLSPRMDVALYWEKRRIQNNLRRVLESVQEKFGLEGDAQATDLGGVFDSLTQKVRGSSDGIDKLDKRQFDYALEACTLWPPELGENEQNEIFSTLLVPSTAAARGLVGGQPMKSTLSRRAFCEGFDRLPFNLPDYPVPVHLLAPSLQPPAEKFTPEQMRAVAEAVATTLCMEQTGLGRVKDVFLTGLLSLEEIQRALPRLVPLGLVEDAVVHIIRLGASLFSPEDWQEFVFGVRTKEACGHAPEGGESQISQIEDTSNMQSFISEASVATAGTVSLASPMLQHREVSNLDASRLDVGTPSSAQSYANYNGSSMASTAAEPLDTSTSSRFRSRFEAVTEPLPCRELRSEDPVNFMLQNGCGDEGPSTTNSAIMTSASLAPSTSSSLSMSRVVDWSTAFRGGGGSSGSSTRGAGHQADEGAGARLSWGTSVFRQELAAAIEKGKKQAEALCEEAGSGPDPVAWIDLELHHECGGPYLARAFVRCCQHYERRRQNNNRGS